MADLPRHAKDRRGRHLARQAGVGAAALGVMALAGCASPPTRLGSGSGGHYFDPKLGVFASPRLVADGEPVPRGGGTYLVGHPYTIGGRAYYPSERPEGYTAVGTASWYGDAFHGRRTANGEIFDKNSISAAHPTLPLPSYVRVTNTSNGRSMIVRVNDRGPYHGGRVMDVSQRVAEALDFRSAGTARIKVEYVGRAGLRGSDDEKLLATLRIDGGPAHLDTPTMLAGDDPSPEPPPMAPPTEPAPKVARLSESVLEDTSERRPPRRRVVAPVPPLRPFDFSEDNGTSPPARQAAVVRPAVARLSPGLPPPRLVSFAPTEPDPGAAVPLPPKRRRPPDVRNVQTDD